MAERITLTSPIVVPASSTTDYEVARLLLDPHRSLFTVVVRSNRGELLSATRQGPVALTLIRQLNKANGATKSLERRALEWLQTQPEGAPLAGAITGTAD